MVWDPRECQEKQSLQRKVGSKSSVGFSSGYTQSCWTCSAGDSQGWVTLDNKTATPGGFWWVWEALLRVVFPADVVHWQRSPAHSVCGIVAVQTSASPPCWDAHGWALESSFGLLVISFYFLTEAGNKFQWCQRKKGYHWDWQRPHHMNFSGPLLMKSN